MDTSHRKYEISARSVKSDLYYANAIKVQREKILFHAAAVGNDRKLQALLKSGVSVDAEEFKLLLYYASKNNMTPLQIASANSHLKCVQILIDHGADVNAKDRFGVTALHTAAENGNLACLKALLGAGADCCLATKISKYSHYSVASYSSGTTALHLAAMNNHVNCVKELIEYGADYNAVDECGRTSLYIAAQTGFSECVLAHLKTANSAVGRDILSLPCFASSNTPLHFAVKNRMVDCVRELLHLGSDVNHINRNGSSPLHLAVTPFIENMPIDMEILKLLILEGYNTNINLLSYEGLTPLHYVCFNNPLDTCQKRRPEMAKYLIAYGADVSIENNEGFSLLGCELKCPDEDCEILTYVIKSMLHLPRLKFLNIHQNTEPFPAISNDPPVLSGTLNIAFEINEYEYEENDYENENIETGEREESEQEAEVHSHLGSNILLEKQLWYEHLATNPRTLQHNCRYVIRKAMCPPRLKHIRNLPIPSLLQSYLLLENGE